MTNQEREVLLDPLLDNNPSPDADQVKQALVGNLCRCSNYNAIVEAVVAAGDQQGGVA